MKAFEKAFREGAEYEMEVVPYLIAAQKATMDEFADVWHDATKTEMAMSYFLSKGTNTILENDYLIDPASSVLARYLEQHIAVELKQTQALINWPKIVETSYEAEMDMHTLIKFFRRRIPCSCLDGEYQRWKHVTKMGFCFNPLCIPPEDVELERSKTKYCSRCRCVAYCCRECQEAHWTEHKTDCDVFAATKAEFEAKQQNNKSASAHRG